MKLRLVVSRAADAHFALDASQLRRRRPIPGQEVRDIKVLSRDDVNALVVAPPFWELGFSPQRLIAHLGHPELGAGQLIAAGLFRACHC